MARAKKAVKKKKKATRKLKPKKPRRAFRFRTHEAIVHLIMFEGKKRVLKIPYNLDHTTKPSAISTFRLYKLFHTLFPENSIEPVGVDCIKEKGRTRWGLVSKILRNRSNHYKKYQALFYSTKAYKRTKGQIRAMQPHLSFAKRADLFSTLKLREQAGFVVNSQPVNVCNVKGNPVFFEVDFFFSHRLRKYINETVKDKKTRKTVLKLLEEL